MKDKILLPRKLTAENGAKNLLNGEYKIEIEDTCYNCYGDGGEEEGETCTACDGQGCFNRTITIPWDLIKTIYKDIVEHFDK